MTFDSRVLDAVLFIFFFLILREARLIFGRERTSIFLWGSILFSGTAENLFVILGGYDYYAYTNSYSFGGKLVQGYPGYVAWVGVVPLCICLGWFVISLPAFVISDRLMGKRNIWLKSAFAALMLVSFDLMLDPLAVVNQWWRWTSPGCYVRGVTLFNYEGWFWLLFFFAAVYERTVMQRKGFRWLRGLETRIFRTDTSDLSRMELRRVARIFYFRLVAFVPVLFVCNMTVFAIIAVFFTNNWGPFESVFPNTLFYTLMPPP